MTIGYTHADNQRRLVCERCGAHQEKLGRLVQEEERELSYRWCGNCLDSHGPCGRHTPMQVIFPDGQQASEPGEIESLFRALAHQVIDTVRNPASITPGVLVAYVGSRTAEHGDYTVLEVLEGGWRLRIGNDADRQLIVNRSSVRERR